MYPFAPSVVPAIRTHMDAHVAFFNEVSKALFGSYQQLCDLNIQLTRTLLEETTLVGHQIITQQHPTEALGAVSGRAQPAADKLRAYQQHLSRIAADAQVELARVADQHVAETSRTAKVLADEVQRAAAEETDRGIQAQQEAMRKFSDPFQTGAGTNGNGSGSHTSASPQGGDRYMGSAGSDVHANPGSLQSAAPHAAQGAPAAKGGGAGGTHKEK